eukprot:613263-Rhodomonas_salina.1
MGCVRAGRVEGSEQVSEDPVYRLAPHHSCCTRYGPRAASTLVHRHSQTHTHTLTLTHKTHIHPDTPRQGGARRGLSAELE